jgi:hypothetical protein
MSFGDSDLRPAGAIRFKAGTRTEVELLMSIVEIIFTPKIDSVSEAEISLLESILPLITEEMTRLEKEVLVDETEAR